VDEIREIVYRLVKDQCLNFQETSGLQPEMMRWRLFFSL